MTSRPGMVDRDDLLRWAIAVQARVELPRVIRRLVLETQSRTRVNGQLVVSAGGWDGSASSTAGTAFVPPGRSGWELSAGSR